MSCTCKYGAGLAGVCGFCKYRKATNKRLEKLEKSATLLDEAYARGVADERAKVVASLRKRATELRDNLPDNVAGELNDMADHYERGDHRKEGCCDTRKTTEVRSGNKAT